MSVKKRIKRKKEHILYSLILEDQLKRDVFKDITIIHNCLSEVSFENLDISSSLLSTKLDIPLIINAMTGGFEESYYINKALAEVAKEKNIALAVGSQKIAFKYKNARQSFEVVRKIYKEGIIFANLGTDCTIEQAKKAVDMIEANALQLHLNVPQELFMKEGRRDFRGTLQKIQEIAANLDVPVIVKEVGFGIAMEEAKKLVNLGINIIDIGGYGGTNFIKIEGMRRNIRTFKFAKWGIPTAISLIEVLSAVEGRADVIASGGIKDGLDVAKALALGAKACGIAGPILYKLYKHGKKSVLKYIDDIIYELKLTLAMAGANNLKELSERPIYIGGNTNKWLKFRGIY